MFLIPALFSRKRLDEVKEENMLKAKNICKTAITVLLSVALILSAVVSMGAVQENSNSGEPGRRTGHTAIPTQEKRRARPDVFYQGQEQRKKYMTVSGSGTQAGSSIIQAAIPENAN